MSEPEAAEEPSTAPQSPSRDDAAEAADADIDESPDEDQNPNGTPLKRRRTKRPRPRLNRRGSTGASSPHASRLPSFLRESPLTTPTTASFRPNFLKRRATMTDIPEDERRAGLSEDEGRDRLTKQSAWRRGNAWINDRATSYANFRRQNTAEEAGAGGITPEKKRPTNLRRLTGFGGSALDATSPWRRHADRTPMISADKWRRIKAGIKRIGRKTREQNQIDHAKSAELIAELQAGAPAALIFASMFQRDAEKRKRIPVLLEQLKLRIVDSQRIEGRGGERNMMFRIELEYGSGLTRMKWVVHRTLWDIYFHLHLGYRLKPRKKKDGMEIRSKDPKKTQLPRFPRSAFPYLRAARGLMEDDESEEEEEVGSPIEGGDMTADEASGAERPKHRRQRSGFNHIRRKSSTGASMNGTMIDAVVAGTTAGTIANPGLRRDAYAERQRKKLETYLLKMIRFFIFRPDSNRLCRFFELSSLGVCLAAEGGYHGKEASCLVDSGKTVKLDIRQRLPSSSVFRGRARRFWVLVRHSYLVAVGSPEDSDILDVILVDNDFKIVRKTPRDQSAQELAEMAKGKVTHPQHVFIKLRNSERKLRLFAAARILHQVEDSINFMVSQTVWSQKHRFNSFAPVRQNVFARFLVDGRDYMWNVSRAISMAKDVIFIHDWWLSPELYLRRPAVISRKWRLDRLLKRKAEEGVKIYVIMYRNINSAIPIDSEYSKLSLLDLHPNVFVQRSPNQFKQSQFFWAHHEKICVIDHCVAFCGGVDLCFGRWDTPEHMLTDDKLTGFEPDVDRPRDADHCQLWPGKDYSNPRVQDFYNLARPYEEMYDRTKVPRMPWHDIGMQVVGQPARDLTRHFIQRWNYLRRQRPRISRPTPLLIPPCDFAPGEIEALGLDGTCEVQMLRSCCAWSIGTPNKVEHSIMDAYVKMIESSEHFVYVENQFYISSCEVEGTKIINVIGDAIVERIKRAAQNDEAWKIILVIPLMPGFQNTVDAQDGTSVRLIMQCQFRSICRGETSLFERLRACGIEPEDYIQFYSLRSWGKIGPRKMLTTEQLYIHAKCMVVDDRVAIIGSANINERSMRGDRDSEVAAIVRDTDMIPSVMAGAPYQVGRFAHRLRMRLMREHLGIDVDEIAEEEVAEDMADDSSPDEELRPRRGSGSSSSIDSMATDMTTEERLIENKYRQQDELIAKSERMIVVENRSEAITPFGRQILPTGNSDYSATQSLSAQGLTNAKPSGSSRTGSRSHSQSHHTHHSSRPGTAPAGHTESIDFANGSISYGSTTHRGSKSTLLTGDTLPPPPSMLRLNTAQLGLPMLSQLPALPLSDDTDIGGPPLFRTFTSSSATFLNPLIASMRRPMVDRDCMRDPLNDSFIHDTWHTIAENNTKIFRQVFRCMPDNEVTTWREYKEFLAYGERFMQAQGLSKGSTVSVEQQQQHHRTSDAAAQGPTRSGPPGINATIADRLARQVPENLAEQAKASLGQGQETEKASTNNEKVSVSNVVGDTEPLNEKTGDDLTPPASNANGTIDEKTSMDKLSQHDSNEKPISPKTQTHKQRERTVTISDPRDVNNGSSVPAMPTTTNHSGSVSGTTTSQRSHPRRRRGTTKSSARTAFIGSDEVLSKEDAEELLKLVQGTLVLWPYDWLYKEERGGNWLYSIDGIAPLEIYD